MLKTNKSKKTNTSRTKSKNVSKSKSNSRTRKNLNKTRKNGLMTMKKMRGGSSMKIGKPPKSFSRNSTQRKAFKGEPNLSVGAQPKTSHWWNKFIPGNRQSVVLPPVYRNPSQAGLANPLIKNTGYEKFVNKTLSEKLINPNINPNYNLGKSHYSNVVPNLNLTKKIQPIQSPQNLLNNSSYNKFVENSGKTQMTASQLLMKLKQMGNTETPPVPPPRQTRPTNLQNFLTANGKWSIPFNTK